MIGASICVTCAASASANRRGERREVTVVVVDERLREHVRRGHGELQRGRGEVANEAPVVDESSSPSVIGPSTTPGGPRPKLHARKRAECGDLASRELRAHATERGDEVLDHAVRVRVVHVPARQLPVGYDVNPGELLRLQNREDRVAQVRARGVGAQPLGDGIASDDGRFYFGHGTSSAARRGDSQWYPVGERSVKESSAERLTPPPPASRANLIRSLVDV